MSVPRLTRRPGSRAPLEELLAATHFRLGPHTGRVAANLAAFGGIADDGSSAWIGADLPPLGAPSVSLGEARATLGPWSFGFLDNQRGIAAFAAPLPSRPRPGGVALVCPRRDALVDVGPLVVARDLGISWILSVGDGDPEEVLAYLARDTATRAVLLAPGAGARPESLRTLDGKPCAVLGGDPLLRAAARRGGGLATDDLESWLAFGALVDAEVGTVQRPLAIVAGGGGAQLSAMARAAGLELPVVTVDDDDPEELERAVAEAAASADLLLLAGVPRPPGRAALVLDSTYPERTRALVGVLAARLAPPPVPIPRVRADRAHAQTILDAAGLQIGDHDTKRVLHTYGVRVSRQAPASSPTAALRVVQQLGFPVDVVVPVEAVRAPPPSKRRTKDTNEEPRAAVAAKSVRRAFTPADLKRATGVLLEEAGFVLIREAFEETPRAQLTIRHETGLGPVARVAEERALLPLDRADAIHLARAAAGQESRPLVDLLARVTAVAVDLELDLDLDLYVGAEPAVIGASARRRRLTKTDV